MAKGIIDYNGKKIEFEPPTPTVDNRGGIYAETVEDTSGMVEVVVGEDGKGYVDVQEAGGKLSELATTDKESYVAAINELVTALANKADKADWQLIRKIEITEELGAVEITKDKEENSFKYDDIMVIANNVKGSNSGNWWVSVKTTANPANSGLIQVGNANPLSSTTAKVIHTKIKRMFGVNRYEYDSSYKNTTAYASTTNKGTYAPPFKLSEETKINYIRIHFSNNNTVNSGTIVVYGRKRR